jgi:hypothetical protein
MSLPCDAEMVNIGSFQESSSSILAAADDASGDHKRDIFCLARTWKSKACPHEGHERVCQQVGIRSEHACQDIHPVGRKWTSEYLPGHAVRRVPGVCHY